MATELHAKGSGADPEFDEDEDLFRFDELYGDSSEPADDAEIDLEDFLKSFAAEEPDANRVEAVLDTGKIGACEGAAPVAVGSPSTQVVGVASLPRWAWALALGLLVGQLLLAGGLWLSAQETRRALGGAERNLERTAHALIDDIAGRTRTIEQLARPLVHSAATGSEADFERIQGLFEEGRFEEARRRLYGILAVVDRHEPDVRHLLEGRVRFLIGDSLRLEAQAKERLP